MLEYEEADVPRIHGELTISRPADVVFDVVADQRHEPSFNSGMRSVVMTTPEPVGQGSRFVATTMTRGRLAQMTIEFTEWERPSRLASLTITRRMRTCGNVTFDPVPGGTRMRWSWDIRPSGALRLLGPLVARMGRQQEARIWLALKAYLESPDCPAPAGEPRDVTPDDG